MRPDPRLPALHEAQERAEAAQIVAAGLADAAGLATADWGGGVWSVRCAALPRHGSGNQVTGLTADRLGDLPALLAWFDAVGTSARLRWPADTLDDAVGATLARHGFTVHEVEAWLSAPIDALAPRAVDHDVRLVTDAVLADAYRSAFLEGWGVTAPLARRVATAALATWPGPASWHRYVAFVDGVPAGAALLSTFDDVAYLADASTVPAYRGRGLQGALIAQRVQAAREAGARTVFVGTAYGDGSWANQRRAGLEEQMVTVAFTRPARGTEG
ncbi:MAG: GNAT family N-acetyltransferase [Alphaproteobacteria bacterium]|nr:GNAT family N-acetyltransferase [Alphaproteobacteria bacterium]